MILNDKKYVKSMVVKSNLPASDFVVNPYIGCPHKCIYCYASFMKRFTGHKEAWGEFLDVKRFEKMGKSDLSEKVVLLSSVTDAYNPYERKFQLMPEILMNLDSRNAKIEILTKSSLILRDIELLKKFKNVKVGISMNTLDDSFRKKIEPGAATVEERISTIKELKKNGIATYLFVAPIFPEITDVTQLIKETEGIVEEYGFENLNLSGKEKSNVLEMIARDFPDKISLYDRIYNQKDMEYWKGLEDEIRKIFTTNGSKMTLYFYHKRSGKNAE